MMRRPQRTEDRLRAGGEDGAYLCCSLEGWGELKQLPRAQPAEAAAAEARARGVPPPLSLQPPHSESATQRHAACGAALHGACARRRCRRTAAACPGRVRASSAGRCSVSSAAARC